MHTYLVWIVNKWSYSLLVLSASVSPARLHEPQNRFIIANTVLSLLSFQVSQSIVNNDSKYAQLWFNIMGRDRIASFSLKNLHIKTLKINCFNMTVLGRKLLDIDHGSLQWRNVLAKIKIISSVSQDLSKLPCPRIHHSNSAMYWDQHQR